MNKSFRYAALLLSSLVISHVASAQTIYHQSTEVVYRCSDPLSVRSWPGSRDECGSKECTVPAALYTTDKCHTYTRAIMPRRYTGPNTYHNLHLHNCYQKHCIAIGEASNGVNNFIPLSYISDDQGMSWKLSSQQPEPITKTDHSDRIVSFSCDNSGMLCRIEGQYKDKVKAKWISQDGGNTWIKILPT